MTNTVSAGIDIDVHLFQVTSSRGQHQVPTIRTAGQVYL